jgi:tetratricopeptide (TPR) repeat protein
MATQPRISRIAKLLIVAAAGLLVCGPAGCSLGGPTAEEQALAEMDRGQMYRELGLTDAALQAFAAALDQNPDLVEAPLAMGDVYRLSGDFERASQAYQTAVKIAPNNFQANYYLALSRYALGRVQDALPYYLRALTINPYDFNANCDLGAAYLKLERPAEGLPYARQATQLHSRDPGAWANLGAICTLVGQYASAADAYHNAAEYGAPPTLARLGEAEALIRVEKYDQAVKALQQLVAAAPSTQAYERLGYACYKARQVDPALDAYRAAVKIDPDDTAALNGLGVCLMTNYILHGRQDKALRDEALDAWRKSVRLRPDQSNIIDLLSRYEKT